VGHLGDVPISELSPLDVQRFASRSGKSASRTRQAVLILRASLDQAVRFGELASNPCDGVKLPRLPRPGGRALTREEVEAIARAADRFGGHGDFVRFLAWTGLRWSEAVELRGRDVAGRRIVVTRAAVAVGSGGIVVGTPKSHASRTVVAPSFLRLPDAGPDELLWTTPRGARLVSQNFRQRTWLPALRRTGVEGVRVHDLRHSACSLLIQAGVHPRVVQQILGHSDIATTMRVYATIHDHQLEEAARALEAL
jgi:integrase